MRFHSYCPPESVFEMTGKGLREVSNPSDVCFAGEVGLSGEIRPVGQTDRRW